MTRLNDVTFEGASLTGANGVSAIVGTPTLDSSSAMKGTYSASIPASSTYYLRTDFTFDTTIYVSLLVKFSGSFTNSRSFWLKNSSTGLVRIDVRSTGKLRLLSGDGSTQIGSDSTLTMTAGNIYRIGIRYTQGSGADSIVEAWVVADGDAWGSPFASTSAGTSTLVANRFESGNTTTPTNTFLIDNIRIDNAAMPTDDIAGGTDTPKTVNVTVATTNTVLKNIGTIVARSVTATITMTKAQSLSQLITYAVTSTLVFAKGMVSLMAINVTVSNAASVLKSVGKPITYISSVIAARNINQPKTIQVSLVGIPYIQKNIGKPITVVSNIVKSGVKSFEYIFSVIASHSLSITKNILKPISVVTTAIASLSPKSIGKVISTSVGTVVDVIYGKSFFIFATVVSNTNLFSQKVIGKTIATVTTIQPSLQKGIDKVIVVAANTSASIRRNIAMTFITISDAIPIAGRNYPMIISLVVTTAATLGSKAISKVILYTSNITATVRKGFALTFEVVSEVISFITKMTGTEFVYAQMNRNVRRIAIGVKNTAIDILGINRRSITLKDKEDDNS